MTLHPGYLMAWELWKSSILRSCGALQLYGVLEAVKLQASSGIQQQGQPIFKNLVGRNLGRSETDSVQANSKRDISTKPRIPLQSDPIFPVATASPWHYTGNECIVRIPVCTNNSIARMQQLVAWIHLSSNFLLV